MPSSDFTISISELSVASVSLVDVHHGREVEFRIDDLVSLRRGLKAREDERLADGNVLMHDDRARIGADDGSDFVADASRACPTSLLPTRGRRASPRCRHTREADRSRSRHRAEAVRDQVNGLIENGKLAAPLQ